MFTLDTDTLRNTAKLEMLANEYRDLSNFTSKCQSKEIREKSNWACLLTDVYKDTTKLHVFQVNLYLRVLQLK